MEFEPEPDLEEEMARLERALILDLAIKRLPERYRRPIELGLDGWNHYDIGVFLEDKSVASVRSTLFRARRMLKEKIKRVAKERGQWPLPALVPWASLHPRRLFGRLRARCARVQEKVAWATQAGSAGVFTNVATGVALTVTLTGTLAAGSIYLLQRSDPEIGVLSSETYDATLNGSNGSGSNASSPAVSTETRPTTRTVSSEVSSKGAAPGAPEASTSIKVGVTRGERATVNKKIDVRLGDAYLIKGDDEGYLISFYCEDDRLNRATCAAIDTIPSN